MSQTVSKIVFLLLSALFPIFGIAYLFGLSGSNPKPYMAMLVAHVMAIGFAFIAKRKNKPVYLVGVAFAVFMMSLAYRADELFWQEHNIDLCTQLKSDPHCTESQTGFTCSENAKTGAMYISKEICTAK